MRRIAFIIILNIISFGCENVGAFNGKNIDTHIIFSSIRWWNYDIFTSDVFGENVTHITKNQWLDFSPTVSPDGEKIAFISDRDGNRDLYLADLVWMDGYKQWQAEDLKNISKSPNHEWSPTFSPDGNKIVFSGYEPKTDNFDIYLYDLTKKNIINLTNKLGYEINPQFSPDGSFIVYQSWRKGFKEIFFMNILEKNEINISKNITSDDILSENYSFSPDGKKIVFTSERNGTKNIYLMDVNGNNQIALTENSFNNYNPSFSPTGEKIIFTSDRRGNLDVYTMNVDGGNQENISQSEFNDWSPEFLPNNDGAVFISDRDGNWEIYKVDLKTLKLTNITNNPTTDYSFSIIPKNHSN